MEKGHRLELAQEIGKGNADPKGSQYPLSHDKRGETQPIVKANETEEKTCKKSIKSVGYLHAKESETNIP